MIKEFKKIYIVGAGGTGSHLFSPLIRYISYLPNDERPSITIIDGDNYSEHNEVRQDFVSTQVNQNKAEAQSDKWKARFKHKNLDISSVPDYLGSNNIGLVEDNCIIFSCVDNHVCRLLLSKHAQSLNNVLFISAGNELTDGNIQIYLKQNGKTNTKPIEEIHPEIATTKDGDRSTMSCEELKSIPGGEQIITANVMAATFMFVTYVAYRTTNGESLFLQSTNEIFFDCLTLNTYKSENINVE